MPDNTEPTLPQTGVIAALLDERAYQDKKYPNHEHTLGEWIMVARKCLRDAEQRWHAGQGDMGAVRSELCQVGAVCMAALEQHGPPLPRSK